MLVPVTATWQETMAGISLYMFVSVNMIQLSFSSIIPVSRSHDSIPLATDWLFYGLLNVYQ